ncbi:hypothetical protein IVB12_36000 [Bradyrhizobium sp. 179]|uniref:hypothetical protein n=1 Tax=Bradyrhizobium sp. 179 TaxID=2782648 RepID=UPI001FF9721D|nr:hypothetical protein [Bradyrhizobium sp. 179]MCK1547185.1 hypothetical protein [Bradyrhizobium sp. 179]
MNDNNEYTFAGPGRKRRERLERAAHQTEPKPDSSQRKAATSKRAPEFRDVSGSEMKKAIRLLTLRTETFKDVSNALERKGYRASGLAIAGVRSDMRATIKLLLEEGLLDERRLKQYRRDHSR